MCIPRDALEKDHSTSFIDNRANEPRISGKRTEKGHPIRVKPRDETGYPLESVGQRERERERENSRASSVRYADGA